MGNLTLRNQKMGRQLNTRVVKLEDKIADCFTVFSFRDAMKQFEGTIKEQIEARFSKHESKVSVLETEVAAQREEFEAKFHGL